MTKFQVFYSANFEDKGIIEVPLADSKFESTTDQLSKRCPSLLQEAGHVIIWKVLISMSGNIPNERVCHLQLLLELLTGVSWQNTF